MTDRQIIIDGVDVSGCGFIAKEDEYSLYDRVYKGQCRCSNEEMCKDHPNCFYKKALKQLKRKEQECEELHDRTASIIYSLTGGRLSYSTYTLEGCEDAYRDQLEIDVKKATKELEEENETLKQEVNTLEQALDEIEKIAKEQIPYLNMGEAKTMIGIEYDYAGVIYNLKQRMYKILQKISKCKVKSE